MATIHPYKGYLNTKFHLYAKGTIDVDYKIYPIEDENNPQLVVGSFSPNTPHSIKLQHPGAYIIEFSDGTSSEINVEDGYKFGGSSYKTSFIFDETPWCFIIMNDRTYFYNRDTDESYVESISPDKITPISNDYVIFENSRQEERTVFSLVEQKPILNISGIVFYNKEILVWQEFSEDNAILLRVYSFTERTIIKTIDVDEFTFDTEEDTLIYRHEGSINSQKLSLPLSEEQAFHIKGEFTTFVSPHLIVSIEKFYSCSHIHLFDTHENKIISRIVVESPIASINSKQLIDVNERVDIIKEFDLSLIGCEEACIKTTYLTFNFYPTKWDIYYTVEQRELERNSRKCTNRYIYEVKSINSADEYIFNNRIDDRSVIVRDNCIMFINYNESLILGKRFAPEYDNIGKIRKHNRDVIRWINGILYVLNDNTGWKKLREGDFSFQHFDEFGIIKDNDANNYFDLSGNVFSGTVGTFYIPYKRLRIGDMTILLSGEIIPDLDSSIISLSSKYAISKDSVGLYLLTLNKIGEDKKEILSGIYDTSSYKSVLLSEDGTQIMYRDNKQTIVLDLRSNKSDSFDNVSYIKDVNGIRPLFSRRAGSLQPRLVNPVNGQLLSCDRMPSYQFVSPNGMLYADTVIDKYVETWNLITNKLLSTSEISNLADNLSYALNSDEVKDNENKSKRHCFIEENLNYFKDKTSQKGWTDRSDKALVESLLKLPYKDFSIFFIEERGIAYIRNKTDDSIVAKIELGHRLWYLNYVSFSYDNRYVAIAGRYPNESNFGGLFLVYDLVEQKEIIAKRNSWAVWLTAFNKQNRVAAYSSEPISYDAELKQHEPIEVSDYSGYSFLTYSPDGLLAALSKQGYISKLSRHGIKRFDWGHMPSCEVFVVNSNRMDSLIHKFSDLSDSGIDGMSDRKHSFGKSVTSVSFSNDNKRLMMVGNDGVVIIRNLHLDNYALK